MDEYGCLMTVKEDIYFGDSSNGQEIRSKRYSVFDIRYSIWREQSLRPTIFLCRSRGNSVPQLII